MSTLEVSNLNDGTTTLATTYVTNGSAKVWVNYTGVTTTAVRDSFNVSSLTDNGTGGTTVNITSSLNNANYTGSYFQNGNSGSSIGQFENHYTGGFAVRTTSSYEHMSYASSGVVDSFHNDSIIQGDLA